MMHHIEAIKSGHGMDQASLVAAAGISASSYKRWKRRPCGGVDPVQTPGAKKVRPIDLGELEQQIDRLDHGKKRTAGTGRLYQINSHRISRREFNDMVGQVRRSINMEKAATRCSVRWLRADLAWAIDGLHYTACHVQNLQDLCSRYKFNPMTTAYMPCGEEIAGHLERHLTRFGPPLFIKRDNAAHALNHRPRRCLSGKNACRSYFGSSRLRYNKRKRKEVYDWIRDLAVDISVRCGENKIDP